MLRVFGLVRHHIVVATLIFVCLTVLMTWPLTLHMSDSVIGWVGDNFYFVWLIGWFQKALFVLHQWPINVPSLNYPEGWNIAYNEITPAMVLIALPASLIGGPTFGYNLSIFVSFVLSGLGVYVWVYHLTRNNVAALIAGVVFAYAPYRISHMLGHLNLMGTQWLPFYFFLLGRSLDMPARSVRTIVLAAVLLGLIAWTSQYYLYMTLILSAIYVLAYVLFVDRRVWLRRETWARLAIFGVVAVPLMVMAIMPYLLIAAQNNLPPRTFEEVRIWSASPTDFLLPSVQHVVWGDWVRQHVDRTLWIENTLYLGSIALLLALLALVMHLKMETPRRRHLRVLAFTGVLAFVLALGTDLHWMGRTVEVDVPAFIQTVHPYERTFLPLPGYFLFKYLPFYANMRVWMRYGIFVSLFVSLLAGIGMAWLMAGLRSTTARWAAVAVLVLVIVDVLPRPHALVQVSGRPVDSWLAMQSGQGAVAQFPFVQATNPEQTYFTLVHQKPFIGGFFAAFATPQFQRIQPVLAAFPDASSVALLRELGVQWVIVDTRQYPDAAQTGRAIEALGLRPIGMFEHQYLYELR